MMMIDVQSLQHKQENLRFFAARIPVEIIAKLDYAARLSGKKKQTCVGEALDEWATKIIVEYMQKN